MGGGQGEMCERDSMVSVPAYEDLPELGAAAMVKATPPAPAALDALGESLFSNIVPESGFKALSKYTAVSYTHPRAHETVLDFVCRLLLVKKNFCACHFSLFLLPLSPSP